MNVGTRSPALAALVLILMAAPGWARAEGDAAPASSAASSSPVSATGLLPIFGVGLDMDALPPGASPEDAVASVQKLWDKYLKSAGFNVIQFPVEVKELGDQGAGRLAKLCVWAKANDVRLAPLLVGAPAGEALPGDYPDRVGAFAAKTIELVGKAGDRQAYSQIMLYQLERPMNHPASHGPLEAAKAAEILRATVEKLHASEQTALAGTSLQATPVLASASFDYELIRFGAIVNVRLTDESYQQAYESLRSYLSAILGSAAIDVVSLEWFPGSVSANAVDRFPDLVAKLQGDFPGKLLLIGTGYSTAAGTEKDQSQYYTQAFNNLSDLRANQGVESSFAGILWRTAMDRSKGEPEPPSSKTVSELPQWNWSDRAAEITRMWNTPGADSKEMRWWYGRVESHFGLLGGGKDLSKPGEPKLSYQLLSHLKTSLAAAAASTGAGQIATELASQPGGAKGVAGAVKEKLQAALFGMLDAWIAKTAENFVSGGGGGESGGFEGGGGGGGGGGVPPPPTPANMADLSISGVEAVEEIVSGVTTPLLFTVVNSGTASATNVVLYLRENASTDLANSTPTVIGTKGSTTITVPWTPSHPGNHHNVTLEAYCDNEGTQANNRMDFGDVPVSPAPAGGGGGGGSGGVGGAGGHIKGGAFGSMHGGLVTATDPGFLKIETVRSMPAVLVAGTGTVASGGVQMMHQTGTGGGVHAMSGTASGTTTMGGTGGTSAPMSTGGGTGPQGTMSSTSQAMTAASAPSGPQPVSLAFTVTNPFDHMFSDVRGTLKVENKIVATKSLGVLFPRQRRTVTFEQWTPPRPGTFPVLIELAGKGPGGRPLTSTATDKITVSAAAARPGDVASGAATRSVLVGKGSGAIDAGRPALATGSMPRTRMLTPLVMALTSAAPAQTRSLGLMRGNKFALSMSLLGVTANSIVLTPYPAPVGTEVSLSVRLFNSERQAASKVKLEAFIGGDKLGETKIDVPVAKPVLAGGFKTWKATPGRHDVRVVVTWGDRSGSAQKPSEVGSKDAIARLGVASLIGRASFSLPRLVLTAADVRLNPPAPAAGQPVQLSVHAQNMGSADAKGVRVEIFADQVKIGEAGGDIVAGKDYVFTGFPGWTPAAGSHVLLCRATVSGQTVEATREITTALGVMLVKPFLQQPMLVANPELKSDPGVIATSEVRAGGLMMAKLDRPDLQILPSDITYAPAMPKPNDPLTITIIVRNIGTAAGSGTVTGVLQVDGSESTRREFPVNIAPGGMTSLMWQVTTPSGTSLTAIATASAANDSQPGNNEARASTSILRSIQKEGPGQLVVPQDPAQPRLIRP